VPDVLDEILSRREEDYARLGPSFGSDVPASRARAVVPFLARPGAILEVKRASPSKGDIAPDLDPVSLARSYAEAGARNVSVLTERRFFKGSLDDLIAASSAHPGLSFLRKDFILHEDEIEVSYRSGADAVLLIARILDAATLRRLASACRARGITAFVEARDAADVAKIALATKDGPLLAGVNARDLATFRIDPLVPAALRSSIPCRAVFESGTSSPGAARFARQLGFDGILIGEAAARDPQSARSLVSAFESARPDWVGHFWREVGRRRAELVARADGDASRARPLVKVCGITRAEDALLAAELGADMLGLVFAQSPRRAGGDAARDVARALHERFRQSADASIQRPLLVGVVVDPASPEGKEALSLALDGVLDAIQYHGDDPDRDLALIDEAGKGSGIGRFAAVRLGSDVDVARVSELARAGEPRVLVDARVEGISGGTGQAIPRALVRKVASGDRSPTAALWLAGGIGPANVRAYIEEFSPELIDASSGLEAGPGKKDPALLKQFFKEIDR
jgi:indole-3-glycerol phosphate synthase/phosphoribosylanthranilate isomerase